MSALSLPVLLIFGISIYAGIFHLLFFINKKENRENLYFALICFSIAFYKVAVLNLHITYFEAGSTALINIVFALIIAATIYVFYILLTAYLRQKRKDILPLTELAETIV